MIGSNTVFSDKLYFNFWRLFQRLVLCALLWVPFSGFGAASENIFILHSYSQEYPWTRNQHIGFISHYFAGNDQHALVSTEYLDTKRSVYNKDYANFFAGYLQKKYLNYQPGIIYVTDDNALKFAIDYLGDLFPQAVVIFSGINDYSLLGTLDPNRFTGVFEKKEIEPNLELIRLIDPAVNEILVVGDGSNTDLAIEQEIRLQLDKQPNIKASFIANKNIEQLTFDLAQRKQKYLFLTTIGAITDTAGNQLGLEEIIKKIASAGEFVIISMEDSYLYKGVLGGYVTSGQQQGYTAATLALAYQKGSELSQLPAVSQSPNLYIFDYQELARHKLNLPSNILSSATILNRPVSFYERYRLFILSAIAVLTVSLFISMTVFLSLLSRKNKKIQSTSDQMQLQANALEDIKATLIDAQRIAHLGNWQWDMTTDSCYWSDEMYRILGEQPQSLAAGYQQLLSYVHDDDRAALKNVIDESIEHFTSYDLEHRLALQDGSIKYVRQTGHIYGDIENKARKLVGTLLDVSSMKKNELMERERLERIERYQDALLKWSRTTYDSLDEAFRRATELSAHTLNVDRVSIWLYNSSHTAIVCHDMYIRNAGHDALQNFELAKSDFPAYFDAIETGKILSISNARTDERSKEFTENYLIPYNIYSMLDTPILYEGEVYGVVCHENINEIKYWETHEQEFASAISNTVALSLEIEKRKQIEKELEHQAFHDALTKLPNRTLFMDRLNQAIKQANRTNTLLAVLFLDLDNFKEINDSLGHAVGDEVLIAVARKLKSSLREVDTISRLGGDEYSLILGDFEKTHHINDLATKLFTELQKPITINGQELYITSSIGISIYPEDGETPDTLLRNADAAMYKAKEEGRNSFQFYTQDMTERAFERVLLESNLRRALEREEFVIYYQPQYDANNDSLIGMEALIRWNHPEIGRVSPDKFIPLAEETGLIVQLDRWVFTTALQQLSTWHKQGLNPGRLALNLAIKQLQQKDFIDFICNTLAITQCKPEWLTFEVTEGQIMKKPEQAVAILKEISNLGIEIAVDDFGTGYSSLAYLKRLPVNKLKIDQSFIRDVPGDEEDEAIVNAVIALAKSMKLSVIAEGVENNKQKHFLLQRGCNQIQGYLYAAPMPARDIEQRL